MGSRAALVVGQELEEAAKADAGVFSHEGIVRYSVAVMPYLLRMLISLPSQEIDRGRNVVRADCYMLV